MTEAIRFTLPIEPVAKGRPRFGNGRTYTDSKTRQYEAEVTCRSKAHRPATPLLGGVTLKARFYFRPPLKGGPKPHTGKPDTDNLLKAIKDGLQAAGFFKNDSQVDVLEGRKLYDWVNRRPRIEIEIGESHITSDAITNKSRSTN